MPKSKKQAEEKSREKVIEEVAQYLDSFSNMVMNELKLQKLDGFSLDGTDFKAVFESAKKTLLSTLTSQGE